MKTKFNKKAYKPSCETTRKQREEFWNAKRADVHRKNLGVKK